MVYMVYRWKGRRKLYMALTKYIEAINTNGSIVINDDFKNLHLRKETSISSAQNDADIHPLKLPNDRNKWHIGNVNGKYFAVLGYQLETEEEMLGFCGNDFPVHAYKFGKSYFVRADLSSCGDYGTAINKLSQLRFCQFGVSFSNNAHGHGVQVFNASGECIFDNNKKYLSVIDFRLDVLNTDVKAEQVVHNVRELTYNSACIFIPMMLPEVFIPISTYFSAPFFLSFAFTSNNSVKLSYVLSGRPLQEQVSCFVKITESFIVAKRQ